ncbi:MAG: helix-turn-helix domain-containing protein [Pseudomonadota bacterium]
MGVHAVKTAGKGTALYSAGEPVGKLYKLCSGAVMLFDLGADGRRCVIDFIAPGELLHFDLNGVFDHYAEALTTIEYIEIDVADAFGDPDFSAFLFEQMQDRLRRERAHALLLGRNSAAERLAEFLIQASARLTGPMGELELPMTRQQIADYTGLTIETVSRLFAKWKRDRKLQQVGRYSYVVDQEALAA